MGAIELPQEIVDRIVDEAYDDRATLRACSLINSQWQIRAREHLFRRLHIRVESRKRDDTSTSNLLLVRQKDTLKEERLEHVKVLLVHCFTPVASDIQPLLELSTSLGRITHLHLHLSLSLDEDYVQNMFAKFNSVTYLYLSRFKITSIADLSLLLKSLPNLEELTMRSWTGSPDYRDGSGEYGLTAPLQKLHTSNIDWFGTRRAPDICSWFADNLEYLPQLDTVRMYDVTRLEKLSSLLEKAGLQLRRLELALATADDGVFKSGVRLQHNKHLQSISVQTGDNIVQFVELINSVKELDSLKELVLTARSISLWDDVRYASWKPVDAGLTSPSFRPELERLVIRATHAPLTWNMVEAVLPGFLAAGGKVEPVGNYNDKRTVWKGEFTMKKMWGDEGYREFRGGE